jgi:hypothetical protein
MLSSPRTRFAYSRGRCGRRDPRATKYCCGCKNPRHADKPIAYIPSRAVKYFRATIDPTTSAGWFPDEPRSVDGLIVDARTFLDCLPYDGPSPLVLPTLERGVRWPLTFGPFGMPVISQALGRPLRTLGGRDLQLIPARSSLESDVADVFIVNTLTCLDCIDESRTLGERWTSEDGRPDKVGAYRTIVHLFVDSECARGAQVFRLSGWRSPLIVSENIADLLRAHDENGLTLIAVT